MGIMNGFVDGTLKDGDVAVDGVHQLDHPLGGILVTP